MILTDEEKAVRDGAEGEARAHAMDLLIRYGHALGAERLVDTNNVCGGFVGALPGRRDLLPKLGEGEERDMDAVYSLLNLDSDVRLDIPPVKAMTYRLIDAMDRTRRKFSGCPKRRSRSRGMSATSARKSASTAATLHALSDRQRPGDGRALRLDGIQRGHLHQFRHRGAHQRRRRP
jgi:hypothetical protein